MVNVVAWDGDDNKGKSWQMEMRYVRHQMGNRHKDRKHVGHDEVGSRRRGGRWRGVTSTVSRTFWAGFAVGLGLPPHVAHLVDGREFKGLGLGKERTRQWGP
jgi:hypothetical protein